MKRANTDPIADFLTQVRNAIAVGKAQLRLPHSKTKESLTKLLKEHGFVADYTVSEDGFKILEVTLFKDGDNSPITGVERISKPGRRVYVKAGDIPRIMGGKGMVVVSTSSRLLDGAAARKLGIGGELICKVW